MRQAEAALHNVRAAAAALHNVCAAAAAVKKTQATAQQAQTDLTTLIGAARRHGARVQDIADATELSRQRIYQILEGSKS